MKLSREAKYELVIRTYDNKNVVYNLLGRNQEDTQNTQENTPVSSGLSHAYFFQPQSKVFQI